MFGEKLKKCRLSLGLTQQQFADNTGITRTAITEYENGKRKPGLKTIKKIAEYTDTKTSEWIDSDIDIEEFDGLKMVIDTLIKNGNITEDGVIDDMGKQMLNLMLEQEVKLYISKNKS